MCDFDSDLEFNEADELDGMSFDEAEAELEGINLDGEDELDGMSFDEAEAELEGMNFDGEEELEDIDTPLDSPDEEDDESAQPPTNALPGTCSYVCEYVKAEYSWNTLCAVE